jgi:5'-3' exonuclease
MGVKGLYEFLKKHANKCSSNSTLEQLEKGPVALDGNSFLYKLMSFHGKDVLKITKGFLKTLERLKAVGLIPIIVFDGPMSVPEKMKTGDIRKKRKLESEKKLVIVKNKYTQAMKYKSEVLTSALALTSDEKIEQKKPFEEGDQKWLTKIIEGEKYVKSMHSLEQQTRSIDQATTNEVKAKLEALNYLCIQSESEGDFVMAHLSRNNQVNYVFADDGDLFVFGATRVVRGLTSHLFDSSKPLSIYKLDSILKQLKLTMNEFVDVCIISKTDYTPTGIKGIGCAKAYKGIQKFGSMENFLKKTPKLQYEESFPDEAKRARELFRNPRSEDYIFSLVDGAHDLWSVPFLRKLIASY